MTIMLLPAIALLFFAGGTVAEERPGDALIGKWYTQCKKAIFDFYREGDEYRARLIALALPDLIDSLNPVDSLRLRKIAGATTIRGLFYNPEKRRWQGGTIYNPSDGRTWSCNCRLLDGGKMLQFRGYLGISALGQTQVWTKTQNE